MTLNDYWTLDDFDTIEGNIIKQMGKQYFQNISKFCKKKKILICLSVYFTDYSKLARKFTTHTNIISKHEICTVNTWLGENKQNSYSGCDNNNNNTNAYRA